MDSEAFRKEYLGQFKLSDESDAKLDEMAREYHRVTEDYDRSVCTGPVMFGGIMPATHEERRLVTRNAYNVLRQFIAEAEKQGFAGSALRKAISKVSHLQYTDAKGHQ